MYQYIYPLVEFAFREIHLRVLAHEFFHLVLLFRFVQCRLTLSLHFLVVHHLFYCLPVVSV